jgi:hypothetical protein
MATKSKKTGAPNMAGLAEAMMTPGPEAMQAWQEILSEWGRFYADRLQQDLETQRAMLACKSPADLMQVQADFYQKAIQQYSEQGMRMMQKVVDASAQTTKGLHSARKYDDVPL